MNGLAAHLAEVDAMIAGYDPGLKAAADLMLCPPATLLSRLADRCAGSGLQVGGQDCHARPSGAHTGDVAAAMVRDAGAVAVILGHSERRTDHGETDADVLAKARAAQAEGLTAIVCVGETAAERQSGRALAVVAGQIGGSLAPDLAADRLVLAYEPVWAIGTGLVPTTGDVAEMHAAIHHHLIALFGAAGEGVRILYGGSVKPSNARELLGVAHVGGALVGGASLKAADFLGIAAACR